MHDSPSSSLSWGDRVREADQQAEDAFKNTREFWVGSDTFRDQTLYAIAAELRATRIAARPAVSS